MIRISRSVQRKLMSHLFDSLISVAALVLISNLKLRRRWKSINKGRINMGKPARRAYVSDTTS